MSKSRNTNSGFRNSKSGVPLCGKTYHGKREGHSVEVTVNGRPLNPRLDLWNHSPTGFEWGYGGSGPAQLALALLADHLDNDDQAVDLHQDFRFQVVATLPYQRWTLSSEQIRNALVGVRAPSLPQTAPSLNEKAATKGKDQLG